MPREIERARERERERERESTSTPHEEQSLEVVMTNEYMLQELFGNVTYRT